jgi:hypothetical protein
VMRAEAAAAGGQARVLACSDNGSQRAKPEDQTEEDGYGTPHVQMMLHELRFHQSTLEDGHLSGIIDASHLREESIEN